MISVVKFSIALALVADVNVELLDGTTLTGDVRELEEDSFTLVVDGSDERRSIDEVKQIRFLSPQPAKDDGLVATLRDGSEIAAGRMTATAAEVTIESAALEKAILPRDQVRSLLLQKIEDEQRPQWVAFLDRSNKRDLLIVKKRDEAGLDFLTGVVSAVTDETVPFLLDGSEIPVPRERIVGVVFAKNDTPSGRPEGARVSLVDGTSLLSPEIFLEDDRLIFATGWDEFLEAKLSSVDSIDYSVGRFHYLSDLPVFRETYFGLQPEGDAWGTQFENDRSTRDGLSSPWRMSRDRFPNTGRPPLTLRGRRFSKGLCIFPSARIEFVLDGRYSALQAVVGVDDDVAFNQQKGQPQTAVELRIEKDGEQVIRKLIRALDDPFDLNVDLTGADTLSLIVDFGDGSSVCDYLDLAEARLLVNKAANRNDAP